MVFSKNTLKRAFLILFIIINYPSIHFISGFHVEKQKYQKQLHFKDTLSNQNLNKGLKIIVGANRTSKYLPLLKNKKIGIVGNQTTVIFKNNSNDEHIHLVDSLLSSSIQIVKVFGPEHGFRGRADAGEKVVDGKDSKTGLPVISLYGKNKKPSKEALRGLDIVIFDIQDVGVRFYTYISTLHYVMEACAEQGIPLLVLDRPNPNGHYIDGPTLDMQFRSFVGMHPVPLVHGMTIGEYAKMIDGEGWLKNNAVCDLTIIPVKNYTHQMEYSLPIRPSPNLPNDTAINLYPSLGLFEGTTMNAGRGTEFQFQIFGSPDLEKNRFTFNYTPNPNFGAKHPKHKGKICHGKDLRNHKKLDLLTLEWIMDAYHHTNNKKNYFKTSSFTIHAGSPKLQKQIEDGCSFEEIQKSWQNDLIKFKALRAQYLLYPD